jgi:hypothetical protein
VKTVSVASAMRRCPTPSRLATMRVSVRHGYGCDAIDEMTNRGCGVAVALDVLHEACTTFLARTQAQRTIAARLEISLVTPGEALRSDGSRRWCTVGWPLRLRPVHGGPMLLFPTPMISRRLIRRAGPSKRRSLRRCEGRERSGSSMSENYG